MTTDIDEGGVIKIKQEGYFYSVYGNDALIFCKYLGYKPFGTKRPKTGFPVAGLENAKKKISALKMNYDITDKNGDIVATERFENNAYEVITSDEYPLPSAKPEKQPKPTFDESMTEYIRVLRGLSEGVNALTGEVIPSFDEELKARCAEMAKFFENKLKAKERITEKYPNVGKKWTAEDDGALLAAYNGGKDVQELAEEFKRSFWSIRSRLLKLGANV